ncbi:ABC transporter ATP-binding protein [Cetobacterium somerae]|uniref:ABC transporter ATP-binding protein n=1 Tax=Cetobacterium sp. NK01 TaxID=2993530 RepID=UPI002116BD4D|nr:ABC transporter ATP-binding protein [Cetobacterium sp. NK01]MCQ8211177.1 ABC transporter ATP-binding protein [Cetobacterium sp. NK01]
MEKLLEVKNLRTSFDTHHGEVQSVRGVTFDLLKGEVLGVVGESGSGKSITMMSIMKLLEENGKIKEGEIIFKGQRIDNINEKQMNKIRGNTMSMIFQDPMTSLNLLIPIGKQIMETLIVHKGMSNSEAFEKAVELLDAVGIPMGRARMNQYPHEFSGGMRQRVMIAMALACNPELLIADEPTTALDVTIQAQILDLMRKIKQTINTSIILITHDLGVVAEMCDRVNVMYGGVIVEQGFTRDIFYNTKHPYTAGLLKSVPNPERLGKEPLKPIMGTPPDLLNPPKGCPFYQRCDFAMKMCKDNMPPFFQIDDNHKSACWLNHKDAPKVNIK